MPDKKDKRPIIIKKIKKQAHGHHGGAWKVAYADFVTAMMAFFLLMWLLNSTTEEQRRGISNYFGPVGIGVGQGGSGGVLGGVSVSSVGDFSDSSGAPAITLSTPQSALEKGKSDADDDGDPELSYEDAKIVKLTTAKINESDIEKVAKDFEEQEFIKIENNLSTQLKEIVDQEGLEENVIIDMTPYGLRIQLIDQEKKSMFPLGEDEMYKHTELLLKRLAETINNVPNKISISGHTDARPYLNKKIFSNWELSTQRANAARRVLMKSGVQDGRVSDVMGHAATDLFNKDDPTSPQNRRISILILKSGDERKTFSKKNNDKFIKTAEKSVVKISKK